MLAACGRDGESTEPAEPVGARPLIDQLADEILAADPLVVIMNESHPDPYTRYVSACLLEAVGRQARVTHFGAETLIGRGLIHPGADGAWTLDGPYVNRPHFNDLLFVAAQLHAWPFAYDIQTQDGGLSEDALHARGLAPTFMNARDRFAAENVSDVIVGAEPPVLAFLHVGHGHGARGMDRREGGRTALLGGHLIDLGRTPLFSVTQTNVPHPERPCGAPHAKPFFDFAQNRRYCASLGERRLYIFDAYVVELTLEANEAGYVIESIEGCTVRVAAHLDPPDTAGFDGSDRWRLEVRQTDGFGRRRVSWSGAFTPGHTRPLLLNTETADLTWIRMDSAGDGTAIYVEGARLHRAH